MYRYIYINTNVFSNMYVYTYVLAYRIYSRICVQVYENTLPVLEERLNLYIYMCELRTGYAHAYVYKCILLGGQLHGPHS